MTRRGREKAATPSGYRALTRSCAVAPPRAASWLEVAGEDRTRFLHGQTTCEVASLQPGSGAYGFLLSAKGRVLADAVISAADDRLIVELAGATAEETAERLRRYVVADRVEIEPCPAPTGWLAAGPRAAETLGRALGVADPPSGWDRLEVADGLFLRGELRLGVASWLVTGEAAAVDEARSAVRAAGAVEAGREALEAVRVERGMPRAGIDFGELHFPQETGLEEWAVSYTKGCYLGQEVVARIHYRGRVNRRLCGVRAAAGAPPLVVGALTDAKGETAGELSSCVWSPALDRAVGLSVLHRRWAETGTRLVAAGGQPVEVVALPFVATSEVPPAP